MSRYVFKKPTSGKSFLVGVDDLDKVGLEAGAADEAAVDVGAGRQFLAVGCGHAAAVQDSQVLGHLG